MILSRTKQVKEVRSNIYLFKVSKRRKRLLLRLFKKRWQTSFQWGVLFFYCINVVLKLPAREPTLTGYFFQTTVYFYLFFPKPNKSFNYSAEISSINIVVPDWWHCLAWVNPFTKTFRFRIEKRNKKTAIHLADPGDGPMKCLSQGPLGIIKQSYHLFRQEIWQKWALIAQTDLHNDIVQMYSQP